ncbi:MAG: PDZ domain-containing protein [Clostridia bacterium]|nr:PDZ domain-containing protein [Clostridia bacterium]
MKYKRGWKFAAVLAAVLLLAVGLTVGVSANGDGVESCLSARGTAEVRFRIPGILFPEIGDGVCDPVCPSDAQGEPTERKLIPGGGVFGIRIACDGVLVAGVREGGSVGYDAGLRQGDLIVSVDGKKIGTVRDLVDAVTTSRGRPLSLSVLREEKTVSISVAPAQYEGETWQLGIFVRDNAAGIGTVTFIDPETGAFGGLGHAIGDGKTGKPLRIKAGTVTGVILDGIERGRPGEPGELKGMLRPGGIGTVESNTEYGVFGRLSDIPRGEAIPVAKPEEVREGSATVLCTLKNGAVGEYEVELGDLSARAGCTKCFSVRVTDPALLALTGGIVRGMSGSPILQNGRLVGAVTHVTVGDPTQGYGVYLDSMLRAMEGKRA